ncbi:M23 family metallopeptidase [Paucidesulfovibrio longus]|uniref:M23 family metallopeptidase n=1 Tax=Paucidesulfovibrio longus TaxID=889 RepID=UPI0003F5E8C0|nr:M23 family metallopeptidase [Paucidesulfovibrio longus]
MRHFLKSLLFLLVALALPVWAGAAEEPVPAADTAQTPAPASAAAQEEIFVLAHPTDVALGQPFAVRLTSSRPLDQVEVRWQGKTVHPSVGVWNGKYVALALLGTDVLHSKPGMQELEVSARVDGEVREFKRPVAVKSKKYPEQRLTLEQKMVTAPSTEGARIAQDRKHVAAALATMSPERRWALPMLSPVPGIVTSQYGYRRILNGQPKNPHRGLDMRAALGEPVHACADGVVVLAEEHYYAGNSVYVDHGNGVVSMYFHLSKLKVTVGQTVQRGDVVGLAGATGRATGPHLHFGVAVQGLMVDPQTLVSSDADALLE